MPYVGRNWTRQTCNSAWRWKMFTENTHTQLRQGEDAVENAVEWTVLLQIDPAHREKGAQARQVGCWLLPPSRCVATPPQDHLSHISNPLWWLK